MADTNSIPLRTRADAKALGLKRYFTGKPCKHGHISERQTSDGGCIACSKTPEAREKGRIRERAARKKANHSEFRAKRNAYCAMNADKFRAYHQAYQIANKAKIRANKDEWRRNNPEKCKSMQKAANAKRRLVEKAAALAGDSTAVIHDWEMAAKKVCYWCGCKCPKKWHLDHYVPMSKGGLHAISNLVISCGPCNFRKSAKDPYEFAASVGRLF